MGTHHNRLPIVVAVTALAVAVLGSTGVGQAVGSAVAPFAKRAGFASNAGSVNGIKASKQPRAGQLVPLGKDGKFPASVGVAGSQGPKGDKGEPGTAGPAGTKGATGPKGSTGPAGPQGLRGPTGPAGSSGISGWRYVVSPGTDVPQSQRKSATVACPAGHKALGGGVSTSLGISEVRESAPTNDGAGWVGTVAHASSVNPMTDRMYVWVICAQVAQ